MPAAQSPEAYHEILLPRRAHEIIEAYEAMTEPEIRMAALAVLQNPVFRWLLVELQSQVVENIKITSDAADQARHCLMLAALELVLGGLIGQAFETRTFPAGE